MRKHVIIDAAPTGGGYLALLYARKHMDVKALLSSGYAGAQALCDTAALAGAGAPVYEGALSPIVRPIDAPCGGRHYWQAPFSSGRPSDGYAWDALFRAACEGPIEIITLGPVTNIAIALLKYPELAGKISRVTFFGGALKGGNCPGAPESEWNFYQDPEAAHILVHSGIPLLAADYSECSRLRFTRAELDKLAGAENPSVFHGFCPRRPHSMGELAAVAMADAPGEIETVPQAVTVETDSPLSRGKLVVEYDTAHIPLEPNCDIISKFDRDAMHARLMTDLTA